MADKNEKEGKSPWVDVRALRWSKSGKLLVQGPENDDFVPIQQYYASRDDLASFTPLNVGGCGFGPIPGPIPTPDGFCTTLAVRQIRTGPNGIAVKTKMGVKSLDELIQLVDREAER